VSSANSCFGKSGNGRAIAIKYDKVIAIVFTDFAPRTPLRNNHIKAILKNPKSESHSRNFQVGF
jgi:hypothetical protein